MCNNYSLFLKLQFLFNGIHLECLRPKAIDFLNIKLIFLISALEEEGERVLLRIIAEHEIPFLILVCVIGCFCTAASEVV